MALNSSTVSAGDDILATHNNNLRLDVLQRAGEYAVATGAANVYAVSVDAQIVAYVTGMSISFEANHTNSAAATINVNTISAISLKIAGNDPVAGEIVSGQVYTAIYDGTNFEIVSKTFPIAVSSDDTTPSYLEDKITGGDFIDVATTSGGGNEKIDIDYNAVVAGTAGETLAADDYVYEKSADGKLYKATNSVAAVAESWNVVGVIVTGGNDTDPVTYFPLTGGEYTTSGLTAGARYYLGTGGALTATCPALNTGATVPYIIGVAKDTTTLVFTPQRIQRRVVTIVGSEAPSSTTTVTCGFPISYVKAWARRYDSGLVEVCFGYHDFIAGTAMCIYNAGSGAGTSFDQLLAFVEGGNNLKGDASVNGSDDLEIAWSGAATAGDEWVLLEIFETL